MPKPCRVEGSSLVPDDARGNDDTGIFILGGECSNAPTNFCSHRGIEQLIQTIEDHNCPTATQAGFQYLTWNAHLLHRAQMVKEFLESPLSPFSLSISTQLDDDWKPASKL